MHDYYRKDKLSREAEELQPYLGPQTYGNFSNPYLRRDNAEILHYYGKGLIKWCKKTEFKKHLKDMIGDDRYKEIEFQLFGYDPFTHNVSKLQFHFLLNATNPSLSKNI